MKKLHQEHDRLGRPLIFGLSLFLVIPCSFSMAQAVTPITSSGLNTAVSAPIALPGGQTQFDITGGTRPGGGVNLFHSFGEFNVPNHNIANFLNDSGLATSNILGRVTGGNISNIFGTIQTTGFGNANLFLMNPAGFLFGPTATVNVGGMMTFTTTNYLKLADGVRFNATPTASTDSLLSTAPVAAFGFLGSNPGAITVQGSQLSVAEGTGISLVGGNMTVLAGTLTAPSGHVTLVSVAKPSNPTVGGEVVVAGSGPGAGFTPTGFRSLGTINLSQGSTLDASGAANSGNGAGSVVIRGGQFIMDGSFIKAVTEHSGGTIEVTAEQVALSNHSTIDTTASYNGFPLAVAGHIAFNVGTFSAKDSAILAPLRQLSDPSPGGAVTIQGLQGSGTFAHAVSLTNTEVNTSGVGTFLEGGSILLQADNIALNQSTLNASGAEALGGPITLVSSGGLDIRNSSLVTTSAFAPGGTVDLNAGTRINLTGTIIDAHAVANFAGSITMAAPVISLHGSRLDVHGTDNSGNGGTIQVEATTVKLVDTQLATSTSGGPQSVAGIITMEANKTTLTNSQILSTATEGHGGTIDITSPVLHRNGGSVVDASSQSGTDGTVTINGVIQP